MTSKGRCFLHSWHQFHQVPKSLRLSSIKLKKNVMLFSFSNVFWKIIIIIIIRLWAFFRISRTPLGRLFWCTSMRFCLIHIYYYLYTLFVYIESGHLKDFCRKFSMWSFNVVSDSRNIGLTQKISLKPNGRLDMVKKEPTFRFFIL